MIDVSTLGVHIPSEIIITSKDIMLSGFTIDWTASTVEGDQDVVYDIYIDDVQVISDLKALSYTFSGLDVETTYTVKVKSKSNKLGTSSSQMIEVTTLNKPTPSDITITSKDITFSGFTINWTASTVAGDQGIVYNIYLDGTIVTSDLKALTYTFSGLNFGATYSIKVESKSSEFGTSSSQMIDVKTLKPIPSDITVNSRDIKITKFTIDWNASTVAGDQGVVYNVYLDGIKVASDLKALTHTFSGLKSEITYSVKVESKSSEFGTSSSQMIEVTTLKGPNPNDFKITIDDIGQKSAIISWTPLTINGQGNVLADIYINGEKEATGVTSSGWLFTDLNPKVFYNIKVVARSLEYGTTLEKEVSFTTKLLPHFKVTSAELYPRITASSARLIIRCADRYSVYNIVLNGKLYEDSKHFEDDGLIYILSDEEFNILKNAKTKEGTINYLGEAGEEVSSKFTYTVN